MTGGLEDLDTAEPLALRRSRHAFDRLIMLSDGVFAIAITLAAIEIRPRGTWSTPAELWSALSLPLYAYMISFAVIAIYWSAHRDTFARLKRVDGGVTLLTLLLLFFTAALPASTQLLYERGNAAGVQVYAVSVMSCGLSQFALWAYAGLRPGLMIEGASRRYQAARGAAALIVPAYFGWLAFSGVREIGPAALYGAIAPTALLFVLRRTVLPRLERDSESAAPAPTPAPEPTTGAGPLP